MATQREAAAHLGMSLSTFQRRRAAGAFGVAGQPRGRAGYDIDALRIAYIRRLEAERESAGEEPAATALDPIHERARRDAAAADKLEHEVAVARGEHVHVSTATERIAAVFAAAAQVLDAVPARLRERHPAAERVIADCEAEIHRARAGIADGA